MTKVQTGSFQMFAVAFAFMIIAATILPAAILLLTGGLFFLGMLTFDREALETPPAEGDVFTH